MISSYKDLLVWQKAIDLVKSVYSICEEMPSSERYVLIPQMQRAAISVPSNIAEGYARKGTKEFMQFLATSLGSCSELETQLIIVDNQYEEIDISEALQLCDETKRMLYVLIRKLKEKV